MSAALTLILPVRGRPQMTRRWLSYAAHVRLPFPVLIADGGGETESSEVAAAVRAAGSALSVRHERRPDQGPGFQDLYARLTRAIDAVETPYAALSANDDFPLVGGLTRAAAFLDTHPDYACCGGGTAGVLFAPAPTFAAHAPPAAIEGSDAVDRVRAQLEAYHPTWYDLHRREALAASLSAVASSGIVDVNLPELLQSLVVAAGGRIMRLPDALAVREMDAPGSTSNAAAAPERDLLDEMLREGWAADFERFLSAAAGACGADTARARAALREAYVRYARAALRRSPAFAAPSPAGRLKRALKNRLSPERWESLRRGLRAAKRSAGAGAAEPLFEPLVSFLAAQGGRR